MRWIRMFDAGDASQAGLLGGKGANLAEMTRMGLPVPPGFTVTTEACRAYLARGGLFPEGLETEIRVAIGLLEARVGRRYGSGDNPLLLSVRSGAVVSMPGMMDTVLNLGLNRRSVRDLAEFRDRRFALDAYRRLLEMYGRVVMGVPAVDLERARDAILAAHEVTDAADLDAEGLHALVDGYVAATVGATGNRVPDDPMEQLLRSIEAVFRSWNGRRARDYRRLEGIPEDLGTAVNVQAMVFGNTGPGSGTGVAFTRDPATGARETYGDFLIGAQGEDVVAGVRHTLPLHTLGMHFPRAGSELGDILARLEQRYRDMCDVEFTVEDGELHILQTRTGKRSAAAAVRIAVDMADEGLIDRSTALTRVDAAVLERLHRPRFDPFATYVAATTGLPASPGAASGRVVFTADDAVAWADRGERVVLVRTETSPDDLHGIIAAAGILTSRGGLVSHAAVVARGIGKPAVCGAADVEIDVAARELRIDGATLREGDTLALDGTTGEVVLGEVPLIAPHAPPELDRLLAWADDVRRLGVRANADTAADARRAREFGAEGIGLCRTEHIFLGDRLPIVQRAILTEDDPEAIDRFRQVHREEFIGLLEAMDGYPVAVRLLDPPLHEFLPDFETLVADEAAGRLDDEGLDLLRAARAWHEQNPMMGIRGVRLGLLKPQLYAAQVQALLEAAADRVRAGGSPRVEIMIPFVTDPAELDRAIEIVRRAARAAVATTGVEVEFEVGTMIETPRAALFADALARRCHFLSFGTNDLTQLTFGFSRDDVEARLVPRYLEWGVLRADPFGTLDRDGVGLLVAGAVDRASAVGVQVGVCGEHGGDPASVAFFHDAGLHYVSCSPYRIRGARLAAAQAALAGAARRPTRVEPGAPVGGRAIVVEPVRLTRS